MSSFVPFPYFITSCMLKELCKDSIYFRETDIFCRNSSVLVANTLVCHHVKDNSSECIAHSSSLCPEHILKASRGEKCSFCTSHTDILAQVLKDLTHLPECHLF